MKRDDLPIKLADAVKQVRKEWPTYPKYGLYLATVRYTETNGREGLPFIPSGPGKRAHKYVKMTDVHNYLQKLAA